MKNCPHCSEEVQDDAIKCKHCGEFLEYKSEILDNQDKTKLDIFIDFLKAKGRMGTKSYFGYNIILIIGFILIILFTISLINGPLFFIPILLTIFVIYIFFILTIKRLHDIDYSGWHSVGIGLALIIFLIKSFTSLDEEKISDLIIPEPNIASFFFLFLVLIKMGYLIFFIYLIFKEGIKGENEYGINPIK